MKTDTNTFKPGDRVTWSQAPQHSYVCVAWSRGRAERGSRVLIAREGGVGGFSVHRNELSRR